MSDDSGVFPKLCKMYGKISDSIWRAISIDAVSRSLQTITQAHHEMHEGDHYFVKTFLLDEGGSGSITEFMFATPAGPVRVHAKTKLAPDVDFTIEIFEGITTSDDGTPITPFNNDRDSVNTPGLSPFAAPTVTGDGTLIYAARNGGGRNPVGVAPASTYEIIAKVSSKYLFRLTKNIATDGIVDVDFWWYEHTPSD